MKPQIFGILNYTPDSFFDGGKNFAVESALKTAQKLLNDGAAYIDIGAEATNPFVNAITAEDEIQRLELVLPALFKKFPDKISLDTYHSETLQWALQFGKPVLNDVSGLADPLMPALAAQHGLSCIVGHLPPAANGVPIRSHDFKLDDFNTVVAQLLQRAKELEQCGVQKEKIILDPNIGFGKTMKLNWQLLEFAKAVPAYKVMIGHSNKRFLGYDSKTGKLLGDGQKLRFSEARNQEAAQIALASGAAYLRVHAPILYSLD